MKLTCRGFFALAGTVALASCGRMTPDQQFVKQKMAAEIHGSKTVVIQIENLSGVADNEVGLRCSPDTWNALMQGKPKITVTLKSADKPGTDITNASPTPGVMWPIDHCYHLFEIYGQAGTKATVEISFPNALEGPTPAEIVVLKTPEDTEAP